MNKFNRYVNYSQAALGIPQAPCAERARMPGRQTFYTVVNQTLPLQIVALTVIFVGISVGCVSCWTFFGAFMRRYLHTEQRRRWFNYNMAALLVLSILPVLWE